MNDLTLADVPELRLRRRLSGRQKAATFLVSLGPDRAAQILKHMPDSEVEALSADMAALWQVDHDDSEDVYNELDACLSSGNEMAVGGLDYTREVLERLLGPEKAAQIVNALTAKGELRPFDFLRRTPPERIRAFLQDESPQTIAVVLASLWSNLAGRVLAELPPALQADVAARIATMQETNPGVIADIDRGLRDKLSMISTQEFTTPGGVDALADILNGAGRSTERNVLETIAGDDKQLAAEIRLRMFTFDDLAQLSDRDMQRVLREVEPRQLILALRGVSHELVEKILANMSQRGAEILRDDMEVQPPQPRAVVEAAQAEIVAIVRRLEDTGALVLGQDEGGQDQMV
jgi:flagellar motor switch protein FliG